MNHIATHADRFGGRFTTRRPAACLVAAGLMLCVIGSVHAAGFVYRYSNAQGEIEIGNSVPAGRAAAGYEVLDADSMRVVEVVAPQLSDEEAQKQARQDQARAICQTALDRVNRMYQSDQDVHAARAQTLKSINTRIENAKVNLAHLQGQKRDLESEAARQERSGGGLNPGLRNSIDRANQQIQNLEEEIELRHQEVDDAEQRFAADLELFIQGTCEDRRAMRFLQAKAPLSED